MAIEATKATGNDTIPPIMAATRPRSSVSGPMVTRSVEVESVAMRITARAEGTRRWSRRRWTPSWD